MDNLKIDTDAIRQHLDAIPEQRRERLAELQKRGLSIPPAVRSQLSQDIPDQTVRKWSWWAYLWDRPRAATWTQNEGALPYAQDAWDQSETFVKGQQELRAERLEREAEVQQRIEAEQAAQD